MIQNTSKMSRNTKFLKDKSFTNGSSYYED